jgi:N utilization substance protein A
MKNEFTLAFNEVLEEKQLPKEIIMEALEAAMVSAYRRAVNASNAQHVEAKIDPDSGKVLIYAEKEVVENVQDPRTEVSVKDAHRVEPEANVGSMVVVETTPRNFGRVAAQTARQVIQQRIREAERDAQFSHYSKQMGEIVSGVVQAMNAQGVTIGLDMKAEGIMPRNQQIPGERFRVHDRLRALLLEVKTTTRGPQIILSRAHRNFLRRLLENEVPEIYHGMVEIRSIAREPGQRSKVAVAALQPGVDPVGACVGIRGVRIQAIVRELNDEKIDVIEWSADPAVYIAKALSPARVSGVYLNENTKGNKTATVVVPEDQLSLAIGRDGQNARLAAKLTSWRIDIKSLPEAATDALYKLQTDAKYAELALAEADIIPQVEQILAKKAEGRPVTPEEYQVLNQFVERVERGAIRQSQAEKQANEERKQVELANIPAEAFNVPLEKFEVSDRVYAVISEAGYQSVGDLMLQMHTDPDAILRLSGMGPKGMQELETSLDQLKEALVAKEAEQIEALEAVGVETEAEEAEAVAIGEERAEAEIEPVEAVIQPAAEEAEEAVSLAEMEAAGAETAGADLAEGEAELVEAEPTEAEVVEGAEAETAEIEEAPAEIETALAGEAAEETTTEAAPEEEQQDLLDQIISLDTSAVAVDEMFEDEDEEEGRDKKKKKKKKKKFVEVEYDPDADVTLVRKKRKRGGGWGDDWDL